MKIVVGSVERTYRTVAESSICVTAARLRLLAAGAKFIVQRAHAARTCGICFWSCFRHAKPITLFADAIIEAVRVTEVQDFEKKFQTQLNHRASRISKVPKISLVQVQSIRSLL